MKLSPNFHLSEFTVSQSAARLNIDNTPPQPVVDALIHTAQMMELVRSLLGNKPILISSGYRSPAVNKAVGGSATSQHTRGEAIDFTCPGFGTPEQIVRAIRGSAIPYDQVILEFNRWVHISFTRERKARLQALVIDNTGTRVFA